MTVELDDLGAAWARVEAALPAGWLLDMEQIANDGGWNFLAYPYPPMDEWDERGASAIGPTPTAALLALAEQLEPLKP